VSVLSLVSLPLIAAASTYISQADVEVRSARLDYARPANTFGFSAVIVNNGPQEAPSAAVIVYLPTGAQVRNAEPCSVVGNSRQHVILRCDLGTLRPGEQRRVFMLVVTKHAQPHVASFAVSDWPDPDSSNNMRDATAP
jgi:hypothetical protein